MIGNLLPIPSLQVHCYPECPAKVRPLLKHGSREADAKPPVGVAPLFYCLHCGSNILKKLLLNCSNVVLSILMFKLTNIFVI